MNLGEISEIGVPLLLEKECGGVKVITVKRLWATATAVPVWKKLQNDDFSRYRVSD